MDSITQAALGAAIGQATLGRYVGKKSMILGAAVATIPDLDVLLYFCYDKFEMLSIHRGSSHSIVFSILGAALLSLLLKRVQWTGQVPLARLWLFSWLALFTHMLLDAFTAYGTQLLLPFSDRRVGWDSINVVDPVYTVPLLLGIIGSVFFNKFRLNSWGLMISSIYLMGTLGVKNLINDRLKKDLADEKVGTTSLLTIPVGSASLQWYGLARDEKKLYLKKYSLLQEADTTFHSFEINEPYLDDLSPKQRERMIWFAKGFYTVKKEDDAIVVYNLHVDMRGVVKNDSVYAPTKGYFKFTPRKDGGYAFSSGSHK